MCNKLDQCWLENDNMSEQIYGRRNFTQKLLFFRWPLTRKRRKIKVELCVGGTQPFFHCQTSSWCGRILSSREFMMWLKSSYFKPVREKAFLDGKISNSRFIGLFAGNIKKWSEIFWCGGGVFELKNKANLRSFFSGGTKKTETWGTFFYRSRAFSRNSLFPVNLLDNLKTIFFLNLQRRWCRWWSKHIWWSLCCSNRSRDSLVSLFWFVFAVVVSCSTCYFHCCYCCYCYVV